MVRWENIDKPKWGVWDTVGECWIGDTSKGPFKLPSEEAAKFVARLFCERMKYPLTQAVAKEMPDRKMRLSDVVAADPISDDDYERLVDKTLEAILKDEDDGKRTATVDPR